MKQKGKKNVGEEEEVQRGVSGEVVDEGEHVETHPEE